jgi:hypothetical protein
MHGHTHIKSIIMNFLFDWISLLFMGFVSIISSLAILYSDDYMFGDFHIFRFVLNKIIVKNCKKIFMLPAQFYQLVPWHTVLQKKLTVTHIITFSEVYRTLNSINVCRTTHNCLVLLASSVQPTL